MKIKGTQNFKWKQPPNKAINPFAVAAKLKQPNRREPMKYHVKTSVIVEMEIEAQSKHAAEVAAAGRAVEEMREGDSGAWDIQVVATEIKGR
jgi:hypothetical protein